jgi:GntR family transcriptional regulator
MREALRVLWNEGPVTSRQGAATTALRRAARSLYTYTVSGVEELLQYASEAQYQVDKSNVIAADGSLAEKPGCPVGQRWLRVEGFGS